MEYSAYLARGSEQTIAAGRPVSQAVKPQSELAPDKPSEQDAEQLLQSLAQQPTQLAKPQVSGQPNAISLAALAHTPVQRSATSNAMPSAETIHQAAVYGVQGSARPLPYLATLQHSFGRHDLSQVKAYTDNFAKTATQAMDAAAYASGNNVVFADSHPSLHTVAHEAAHVIQQQGGVQLKSNVGAVGDQYEQHAEQVAELVTRGQSAEQLLNHYAPSSGTDIASVTNTSKQPIQMTKKIRKNSKERQESNGKEKAVEPAIEPTKKRKSEKISSQTSEGQSSDITGRTEKKQKVDAGEELDEASARQKRKARIEAILEANKKLQNSKKLRNISKVGDSSEFEDSSDEEDNAQYAKQQPYGFEVVKKFFNRQQSKARPGGRLGKLLKDIKAEAIKAEILNGQKQLEGKSHQSFITKDFKLKKDNESGYKFYSALSDWYENLYLKMPDSQPSSEVESASKTIVPSFRGVALWEKKDTTGLDGFLNRSEGPGKSYPSTAYHLAEVSFMDYVLEKVDLELLERMGQVYDLQPLKDKLLSDNKVEEKLDQASAQLKAMLDDTDNVTGSFDEFGDYFGKDLFFANEKFSEYKKGKKGKKEKKEQGAEFVNRGKDTSFKLGDIISHIYTNAYARFQKILENNLLSFTKKEQPAGLEGRLAEKTQQLLTNISELATNKNDSKKGMPILSEGQIPRHALLYATHNKQYNIDNKLTPTNLYENDGKPISFYLGKLYINTYSTDKINGKSVKYIPAEHQKENVSIGAVIGGEQEIQHRGGNNNKAEKVITIKLPKFNLKEFPQRYQDKYGLTKELWKAFKDGFKQLNDAGLWNTAASFYLESLILTHLIEFHEAMSTALVAEKGSIHMMGTRDKADVENKDFEVKFHLIEQHSDVKELKGFSHKVHEINPKESNIQEE